MAQVARTWTRSLLRNEFVRTLKDVPSVLGFETLNEPHPGWLGLGPSRGFVSVCCSELFSLFSFAHMHFTCGKPFLPVARVQAPYHIIVGLRIALHHLLSCVLSLDSIRHRRFGPSQQWAYNDRSLRGQSPMSSCTQSFPLFCRTEPLRSNEALPCGSMGLWVFVGRSWRVASFGAEAAGARPFSLPLDEGLFRALC